MKTIDTSKLVKVDKKSNGDIIAQCPACAAAGGDTTGNHLKVFADGKFNCVVHTKNKTHNKEILRLAGIEDCKPQERAKVQIRRYKIPCTRVIGSVARKTWEELGFVPDPSRPARILRG